MCPACGSPGQDRASARTVRYADLRPSMASRCGWPGTNTVSSAGAGLSGWQLTSGDHRIAAKNCLLTTRLREMGDPAGQDRTRGVSDVAQNFPADWHTVNDAAS